MTPFIQSGDYMNVHHNIVHAVQGGDVLMTMVGGQVLVKDGKLEHANLSEIIVESNKAIGPLLNRRDKWIATAGISVNELEQ